MCDTSKWWSRIRRSNPYNSCSLCHLFPDNLHMMTSLNGNIFRVAGPLCGEFTGHLWPPRTKASDAELWCFLWSAPWINSWVNNREAGDLRRHCAHYDIIVMTKGKLPSVLLEQQMMFSYNHEILMRYHYSHKMIGSILFHPAKIVIYCCQQQILLIYCLKQSILMMLCCKQ